MAGPIIWAASSPEMQWHNEEQQLRHDAEGYCQQRWTEAIARSNPAIPTELFNAAAKTDYHNCLGAYYAQYYATHPEHDQLRQGR
jgi:hypothetical protein